MRLLPDLELMHAKGRLDWHVEIDWHGESVTCSSRLDRSGRLEHLASVLPCLSHRDTCRHFSRLLSMLSRRQDRQ